MKQLFRGFKFSLVATFVIFALSFAFTDNDMMSQSFADTEQPIGVVKVKVHQKRSNDVGSGSLIRADLILTANHVVRDYRRGNTVKIYFRDGLVREAKIIKTSERWDLALLKIDPVLYPVLRPAKESVVRGQPVTICGFPKGKEYREITGNVEAFWRPDLLSVGGIFSLDQKSISGMSGGPALNKERDVVGLMWGSDDHAHCTGLEQIKNFLKGVKDE